MRRAIPLLMIVTLAACERGMSAEEAAARLDELRSLPSAAEASPTSSEKMLRVVVHDDTRTNRLPANSEIWFRGHGSWWLQPATRYGPAAEDLGRRRVGVADTLFLYPDGREGREIRIPVMMTADMCPDGCDRDPIIIEIGDREIEVFGSPVETATFRRK